MAPQTTTVRASDLDQPPPRCGDSPARAAQQAAAPDATAAAPYASRRGCASAASISASVRWAIANAAFPAGSPA